MDCETVGALFQAEKNNLSLSNALWDVSGGVHEMRECSFEWIII